MKSLASILFAIPLLLFIGQPICFGQELVQSFGSRFTDPAGDVPDGTSGAFDLTGLKLQSDGIDTITATIVTRDPIAKKPSANFTWYGFYLDLDRDSATGFSMSDNGMDVVFSIEAVRAGGGWEWKFTTYSMSNFAKKFEFVPKEFSIDGNQVKLTMTSKAFKQFPQPIIGVWSHDSGNFNDNIKALKNNPIQLFSRDKSAPGSFALKINKVFSVSAAKYQLTKLPIDDKTREVICDITVKKANLHEKWLSMVQLRLYDLDEERRMELRVAPSVKHKEKSVARVHISTESEEAHYYDKQYVGKHQLKMVLTDSKVDFYFDGKKIESHPKRFSIGYAKLFILGTEGDAVISIF